MIGRSLNVLNVSETKLKGRGEGIFEASPVYYNEVEECFLEQGREYQSVEGVDNLRFKKYELIQMGF